ncbi:MAG: response regulator transcription factor [Neisseriaceae bacterium]|nr:response regulator transcription factor [Neisseriaceae bacterium]MBP6863308.1 response regulator transcription factor [Neisseriaceae bacterium]
MTTQIKILLIDDHTLFRSGIKALLQRQADFLIVGEAADGLEGVKLTKSLQPDIVLLDLDMPVMNGQEALAQILSADPEQVVLMLTVSEDAEDLTECMRLGAKGFLLKNINAEFLLDSIRKAVEGDTVFSPEMTAKLVQCLLKPNQPPASADELALQSLTPRETETLSYLAVGASNKEIARKLDLAESTIKVHVQSILRKLELSSRVQAAVFAVKHNVVAPPQ